MTESKYLVLLAAFLPFGSARIGLLKKYFGSYKKAWNASTNELKKIGLKSTIVRDFKVHREELVLKDYFDGLKDNNTKVVTVLDKNYPDNLVGLDDAPPVLYIKGVLKSSDKQAVAIVGSRKMTSYGKEVTKTISSELSRLGVTIVSGLAFGVDVSAHKSALDSSGRCIAVLASGVDNITPRSNTWLAKRIISEKKGVIISEYPLGTDPQKAFFPHRNRIISGMAKAVVVVEGENKSGTLHTANHAAKQGREVFAVPGQITSPMSQAPHYLIKNGAKMLTKVEDILEELNLQLKVDSEAVEKIMPGDKQEEKLIGILSKEPLHLDEIARLSKLDVSEISSKLTVMELKGMVKALGNGVYRKV